MKQFAVIGLGNFGFYLATRLYSKGHEVMAIDTDAKRVQEIKNQVSQAVVADGTDRQAVEDLGLPDMDAVIVSIGTHMDRSILATLLMKEAGVGRVLVMAINEEHGRVLEKMGASEVLFPERDFAFSVAERLDNPNMLEYLPFVEGYSIVELIPPPEFIGKSLAELDLINRYGMQVVAVREARKSALNIIPTARFVVKESDLLIILGPNDALERIRESEK